MKNLITNIRYTWAQYNILVYLDKIEICIIKKKIIFILELKIIFN
jgi:hypothetical protein